MNSFLIRHFDDSSAMSTRVATYMVSLNQEFVPQGVSIEFKPYLDHTALIELIHSRESSDLIILDMYKGKEAVGKDVLMTIEGSGVNTPVVLYTHGTIEGNPVDYDELLARYPFIFRSPILKTDNGEQLKEVVRREILRKKLINKLFEYDEDDIVMKAAIQYIGEDHINDIIYRIKKDRRITKVLSLERLAPGFSGAAVFRLGFEKKSLILKISKQKEKLKQEYENSQRLFLEFPQKFRVHVDHKKYENSEVFAILIEEMKNSKTLFDWLLETLDKRKIEGLLHELFFDSGLQEHYECQQKDAKVKFVYILEKFNYNKLSLIEKALQELSPILSDPGFEIDVKKLLGVLTHHHYDCLDKTRLLNGRFQKNLVLCHGDFHAKNVLVQGERLPKIIDTGAVDYDYWCMDVCRLIVNLFITGFDYGKKAYFDLDSVNPNVDIARRIIHMEELEGNSPFAIAINWLIGNVAAIYGDLFTKWEFQLGLLKEFMQLTYRSESIPPNRKVIAVLAAYQCLLAANEEVSRT